MEHLGFGPSTGVRRAVYLGRVGGDPGPGWAAEHLGELAWLALARDHGLTKFHF